MQSGSEADRRSARRELRGQRAPRLRANDARAVLPLFVAAASACSNILVSPGAAEDGTHCSDKPRNSPCSLTPRTAGHSHISYNADDAALFGAVSHWPAASHPPGAMREIYSWDLGIKLGEIPQPPRPTT